MVTSSSCSNSVHLQVCILISAQKTALFRATHVLPKKNQCTINWKLEINISQGSAAALCRWGGQINNFCVAYFLNILCAKYCRNRSTCIDTTVKWTRHCFIYSCCILKILNNLSFQSYFDIAFNVRCITLSSLCLLFMLLQALESKLANCRAIDRSQVSSFLECTSPTQSTPK